MLKKLIRNTELKAEIILCGAMIIALFVVHPVTAAASNTCIEGFETGTFGKWTTVTNDFAHDNFVDVALTLGAIHARSGNFMATIPQSLNSLPMQIEKVLDQAGQGTLTGYVCVESWNSTYSAGLQFKASDDSSGALIIANPYGSGRVYYKRDNGVLTDSGIIAAAAGVWHEIKFVVDGNGVDGYWDGTPLFINYNSPTKNVKKIIIGSPWPTARCGYDDISFPSPQIEPVPPEAELPPPVLQVLNKPFFLLGYFDNFTDTAPAKYDARYAAYRQQSMNTVLHWGTDFASSLPWQQMAADSALRQGLKYIPMINDFAVTGDEGWPLTVIDDHVDALWYYPALLGWYVADEPEISANGVYPPRLQMIYERINNHDPSHHPQFVVFCQPFESYIRAEPPLTHDVTMCDVYPCQTGYSEFGNPMWPVATRARQQVLVCKIAGTKKAQIGVLQACGYPGWGSSFRMPTANEQRYMSYASIVEGSRGLLWWEWVNADDPAWVQARANYQANVIGPIATEINSLIPAIVSNSTAISVTSNRDIDTYGHGIEDVTYLFGEDVAGAYLIAVNHTPTTLSSVRFSLTGAFLGNTSAASEGNIDVLFENRQVILQPDSGLTWVIMDDFLPYAVHVYRINQIANCADVFSRGYALIGDLNKDCYVDLKDLGQIAADWLSCINPTDPNCDRPWQ